MALACAGGGHEATGTFSGLAAARRQVRRSLCARNSPSEPDASLEGYGRHAFLEANFKTFPLRKFQVEVYAKWPGSKGTRLANLPPDIFEVCAPQHQHPQSPGVAHGSRKSRSYTIGAWMIGSSTPTRSQNLVCIEVLLVDLTEHSPLAGSRQ
jgi:hypothetical protein